MYNWNDLKVGRKFLMDGLPFEVVSYAQKVMGRGWSIINIKAKNLVSWGTIPKTFSDYDKFAPADIATMSTWLVIQVPLFINIGDKLKIDTRNKEYQSRA